MLYLNAKEIREIFSMREAIESDREAFMIQAEGLAEVPVRTNFDVVNDGITSFMPALIKKYPRAGIKIVSTYTENYKRGMPAVSATVLLADPETGVVNAMLDGTELTRMRTGAVSGLATELLSNEDAERGALFGTGGQAASQLEAVLTARPLKEVRVFDMTAERVADFISRMEECASKFGTRLVSAGSPQEAVTDADIITTVTTSPQPVFDGRCVKPGAHINAVGTFLPHKRELDEYIVRRADRIFIDNREAVMSEAGEFLIPMSEGRFSEEMIAGELGDLLLGRVAGRSDKKEITLMKTVGFATLDIVIAHKVYEKALKAGIGTEL